MFGTAAISAVGAISQLAIMLILDLPFAVPIAVLSFIACFIPYYGGFITTGLAFLIAVGYGTPTQIVIMFVYTIVFNLVQGNIVTPLVYNRTVHLHPAVVLLAIPAGGAVAGVAGMFLAVPILAVIATTWRTLIYVLGDRAAARPVQAVDTSEAHGAARARRRGPGSAAGGLSLTPRASPARRALAATLRSPTGCSRAPRPAPRPGWDRHPPRPVPPGGPARWRGCLPASR